MNHLTEIRSQLSFHDIPDNVEPTRRIGYHKHANANWRLTLKYLYVLHTTRDAKVTQRPILNVGDKRDSFRASLLLFPPWFASSVCIPLYQKDQLLRHGFNFNEVVVQTVRNVVV